MLFEDYTGYQYEGTWGDEEITWGLGTGRWQGEVWILDTSGYEFLRPADGRLINSNNERVVFGREPPPAGGHYRIDATLTDFNGSWVIDYVLFVGTRWPVESLGEISDDDVLVLNAFTINNGVLTESEAEGSQPFTGGVSMAKLTVERAGARGLSETMSFTLHESGAMRYFNGVHAVYYQRVDTPEPTPSSESTPEPSPSPDPKPSPASEPSSTPEETTQSRADFEPTRADNSGSDPDWLVIAIITFAVVAIGCIVTFTIVWNKKAKK